MEEFHKPPDRTAEQMMQLVVQLVSPPLPLQGTRRLRPARAQGPKVRRLAAGGKWIRTFGSARETLRFSRLRPAQEPRLKSFHQRGVARGLAVARDRAVARCRTQGGVLRKIGRASCRERV